MRAFIANPDTFDAASKLGNAAPHMLNTTLAERFPLGLGDSTHRKKDVMTRVVT
jgi:hypothetical protein